MSGAVPRWAVFLGPSLPLQRARQLLDADYLPPARMGDVYALLGTRLAGIVLIDGVFHGQPSIWQRELLAAIDGGVPVIGASSMGALRAAELAPLGMIGCGEIFGWYRDGVIEADDAVALLHAPAEMNYRPLSTPLVNMMATLRRCEANGRVSDAERLEAERLAASRNFHERSWQRLLADAAAAGWTDERLHVLAEAATQEVDQKAADAEVALRQAAQGVRVDMNVQQGTTATPQRWRLGRLLRGAYGAERGDALVERLRSDRALRVDAAAAAVLLALHEIAEDARTPTHHAAPEDSGLLPAEAAALAQRHATLQSLRGGCSLEDAARKALANAGVRMPDAPSFADWLIDQGPAKLGLPYEEDAALIEWWQACQAARDAEPHA